VSKLVAKRPAVERYAEYVNNPAGFAWHELKFKFTPGQERMALGLIEPPYKVLAPSANSQGKCVAESEVITLADGSQALAGELVGRSFALPTLQGGRVVAAPAFADWNAVEDVYEITLDSGIRVVRNAQHPLWSSPARFQSGRTPQIVTPGWHGAGEIQPGWAVAVADEMPVGGRDVLTDDEAKLLGYLIGDGGLTTDTVVFTQQDGAQLDEFRACLASMGAAARPRSRGRPLDYAVVGTEPRGPSLDRTARGIGKRGNRRNRVNELVRRVGMWGKGSRAKFIPNEILSASPRQQALFLSRLFSTDGWACVSRHPGRNDGAEIGYGSSSERLARDVQRMLWRFGVHFGLRHRPGVDSWTVSAQGAADILAFADRIGIYGKELAVARACGVAVMREQTRDGWRSVDVPTGCRWSKVKAVRRLPGVQTVAVTVPGVETFLTPVYEHNTSGAAAVVLWWFCTRTPAIVRTTAPKYDQVRDLLWKEIRRLARRLKYPLPFLPKACRIERSEEDYAVGTTATGEGGWKGHHGPNQLFIFDEATDVADEFWTATDTMFQPPGHAWLCIFNPTTTTSRAYLEYSRVDSAARRGEPGGWTVVRMSALEHPNIEAELKGEEPPVPDAMRAATFGDLLRKWSQVTGSDPCKPIGTEGGPEAGDVVWPPLWATEYAARTGQAPTVYRPGPEAESCLLARFPSQGTTAVWGDADWLAACRELPGLEPLPWPDGEASPVRVPEIGCDVARFGDDMTEIHARSGCISLGHESASKRPTDQTAGRLVELCRELARWYNDEIRNLPDSCRPDAITERDIPIKLDDDGVGGGVSDILIGMGYTVCRVSAAGTANDEEHYPNKRSELWFVTAEMAREGRLDLSGLDVDVRDELRRQALTAKWALDSQGRRVVMPKDKIKAELKRSPDGVDALNLCYYPATVGGSGATVTTTRTGPFGRGW
jgi:hypothetical protein